MDSNTIQSDKKRNFGWSKAAKWFRKYILTAENIICLAGFLLSVIGFHFTDFDPFQYINSILAMAFMMYALFGTAIKISRTEDNTDILKPMVLPLVILLMIGDFLWVAIGLFRFSETFLSHLLHEYCGILILPFQAPIEMLLQFLHIPTNPALDIIHVVEPILARIGLLGILGALDIGLLLLAPKNKRLSEGKKEFTIKWGLLVGIRYLVGLYQLVFLIIIPLFMLMSFSYPFADAGNYEHGVMFFIISPLVLYSFAYIFLCKHFFKESRQRNLCIAASIVPFFLVMTITIIFDSISNIRELLGNGSTSAMLYLYAARDLILLLFTAIGISVAIFGKRIPAIRLMLAFYVLIYLLTMFSLPEYWIMKDIVARIQKEDLNSSDDLNYYIYEKWTPIIVEASSDATPAIIPLLDEADWRESLEYMELRKQEKTPACTTCFLHYKYEWVYRHCQKKKGFHLSQRRSIQMIEEKLEESKEY